MKKKPSPPVLSVAMAIFNEEKFLGKCLRSITNLADEIIIVDGGSTDRTVGIARRYGAEIIHTDNPPMFHVNKQKAIDQARGSWILQLDADEVVTEELSREIESKISSSPKENGFWIPRKNWFLGRFLTKGGAYPDYTLRLYRRGKGRLPCKSVHEQAVVEGETGQLTQPMLHYADPTFGRYIMRFNRYTDLSAESVTGGVFRNLVWKPLFDRNQGFFSIYFRHLGFLDGFPGFIWALFSALNFPIAFFKSLDRKRTQNASRKLEVKF